MYNLRADTARMEILVSHAPHTDGPCTQAAFEAMDVLLDNARDQLDFPTFVSHLEAGLSVHRIFHAFDWGKKNG